MLERILPLLCVDELRFGADPAVVERDREASRAEGPVQAVDSDELLDADTLLFDAALQTGHLLDILVQTLALDAALIAHVLQEVVFVDAADDRGGGRHRADHAGQHDRQNDNRNHDAAAIEEKVPHAATDVARNDLDLDHL